MNNRRLRKEVWLVLAAVVVIIVCLFINMNKDANHSADNNSTDNTGGGTVIENEGDIEIVIPEEMDSDGF